MKRFLFLLTIPAIGSFALLSLGCSREQSADAATTAPVRVEAAPDPSVVEVDHPEEFPLVTAEARTVHNDLTVNGVVAPDVSRTVPVNSLSGGRVIEIHARLGDVVEQGQVLLKIHSPDLAQALADYQKAMADEVLARRALDRAQLLYSHGALAEKDLQVAEDTEAKAKVDVATTSGRIRILGGDINTLSPIIDVKAPAPGTIVAQNITGGAGVKSLDNAPDLFTIADLSEVWVLCDVYENNLSQVHVGDYAEVRLNAYPDKPLKARVSNIMSLLDPTTRTVKVRLQLRNPGGILKPGMFATAKFISQGTQKRVLVPATALLRLHDKDWVFRPQGGKLFRRVEVQAGEAMSDGAQQVLAGLQPGDKVVSNALQFSSAVEQK